MKEVSLFALIEHVKNKGKNPKLANVAFTELYERIKIPLFKYCIKICKSSPYTKGGEYEEDLIQDSIISFYVFSESYKNNPEIITESSVMANLIAYFKIIITRKWLDKLKTLVMQTDFVRAVKEDRKSRLKSNPPGLPVKKESLKIFLKKKSMPGYYNVSISSITDIIKKLPEREQDVLLTYLDSLPAKQISGPALERLVKKYVITKEYIRTIKLRVFKIVKKEILAIATEK